MLDMIGVSSDRELQLNLHRLNGLRLHPRLPSRDWRDEVAEVASLCILEGMFIERGRNAVADRAASAPMEPDKFIASLFADSSK